MPFCWSQFQTSDPANLASSLNTHNFNGLRFDFAGGRHLNCQAIFGEVEEIMKRLSWILALGGLLACGFVSSAWAQATAQISGTVKDQSGAVLPGVEVSATQTATGNKRTVLTNETGSYVITNLPVGPYRVEAALAGFRTFVQTGIVLQVDSNPVININLEVGQVSTKVEVQEDDDL